MKHRIEINRHNGEGWTWLGLGYDEETCTFDSETEARQAINVLLTTDGFQSSEFRVVEVTIGA